MIDNLSIKFFIGEDMVEKKVIAVVSGKGGVGKTTITANLGIVLALDYNSVCLVDGDFGLNNLDCVLGVETSDNSYDFLDIVEGNCRLNQAVNKDDMLETLYLLTSSTINSNKLVSKDNFSKLIQKLNKVFDYTIIDAPAGLEFSFERAIMPATKIIVVVTPTITSLVDASKTIQKLKSMGKFDIVVVVNRLVDKYVKSGDMVTVSQIEELLLVPVIGVVHENINLCVGKNLKTLFNKDKSLLKEFRIIVGRV